MADHRTLDQVSPGEEAVIAEIQGPQPFVRRLLSLGVAPGISLKVLRRAPLGDPLQVQIGSMSLAIRRGEARHVILR